MGNIFGYKERDVFDFMGSQFDWYEGGKEEFAKNTGGNISDYWNARKIKWAQQLTNINMNGIQGYNGMDTIMDAVNRNSWTPLYEDYGATRDVMLTANDIIKGNRKGSLFAFDTETLGDMSLIKNNGYAAITEIGFAKIEGDKEVAKTAVFGINRNQKTALNALYDKYIENGFDALNRTEQSTIERLTRYRDITNRISYDVDLNAWTINNGIAEADVYNPASVKAGIEQLSMLYDGGTNGKTFYSGQQDAAMNRVISKINMALDDNDTAVFAKNKMYDINAINNEAKRNSNINSLIDDARTRVGDVQSAVGVIAHGTGKTVAQLNAMAAGGQLWSNEPGSLSAYFEIMEGRNASFSSHVAGEDSLQTIKFAAMNKYLGKTSLLDAAENMFLSNNKMAKEDFIADDISNGRIYIKRNAYDYKNDLYTQNINGKETAISGFSGTNMFWKVDSIGEMTFDAVNMEINGADKEISPERNGILVALHNEADENIKLYKFFDNENHSTEDTYRKVGEWFHYNTDITPNEVTEKQVREQFEKAIQDKARRKIDRLFDSSEAGVQYKSNGIAQTYKSDKIADYLKDTNVYANGFAEAERYANAIKEVAGQAYSVRSRDLGEDNKENGSTYSINYTEDGRISEITYSSSGKHYAKTEQVASALSDELNILNLEYKKMKSSNSPNANDYNVKQWILDSMEHNGFQTDKYLSISEFGYVANALSGHLDMIEDVGTALRANGQEWFNKTNNLQRTIVFEGVQEQVAKDLAEAGYTRKGFDFSLPTISDQFGLSINGLDGKHHKLNMHQDDNQVASQLVNIYKDKSEGGTINNILKAAQDLVDRKIITQKELDSIQERYPARNNAHEYAKDISNYIRRRTDKFMNMSLDEYQQLSKEVYEAGDDGLKLKEIRNKYNINKQGINVIRSKNTSLTYDETDKVLSQNWINENGETITTGQFYAQNRDKYRQVAADLVSDIGDSRLMPREFTNKSGSKNYSFISLDSEIYSSRGGIHTTRDNLSFVSPGKIGQGETLKTYRDVLNHLGYDAREGSALEDFFNKISSVKYENNGHESEIAYSIAKQGLYDQGIRYGVTATENAMYIFGTNAGKDEANAYKVTSHMTGNETDKWVNENLGKYAGLIKIGKITNKKVGEVGTSSYVTQEIADLLGNGKEVMLQSMNYESGLPVYMSRGLNVYKSNGKINADIRPMQDEIATAIRRGKMPFFTEKLLQKDYSGATGIANSAQNAISQNAPMSDSFVTDPATGKKFSSFNMSDLSRAFEFRLGGVVDDEFGNHNLTGMMKLVSYMGQDDKDFGNSKIQKALGLYNLATNTVTHGYEREPVSSFSEYDVNKLLTDNMFREYYNKSVNINSVVDDPVISRAIASDNMIKAAASDLLGITLSDTNDEAEIRKRLNDYFMTDTGKGTWINLVNEAVNNNDKYSPETVQAINKIQAASKYMSQIEAISSMRVGNVSLINVPMFGNMSTDSSSVRPTAISMYHTALAYNANDIGFKDKAESLWVNLGMSSMTEQLWGARQFATIENGAGDRPIYIKGSDGNYKFNPDVKNWNTQQQTMQVAYASINQEVVTNRLNDTNIAKQIAKRSADNTSAIHATYGEVNEQALKFFMNKYKDIAQFQEGKNVLRSELYSDAFFSGAEAKRFKDNNFKDIIAKGPDSKDYQDTLKVLNELRGKEINKGDLIGFNDGKAVRYNGAKAIMRDDNINELLESGTTYLSADSSVVNDMKINLGQEKNTATGINMNKFLEGLDYDKKSDKYAIVIGKDKNGNDRRRWLTRNQIESAQSAAFDVMSDYAQKILNLKNGEQKNIMRASVITTTPFYKHNLALPLETQWGIITNAYQKAGRVNELVDALNNTMVTSGDKTYNFGDMISAAAVDDFSGRTVLRYNPEYSDKYNKNGMAQGVAAVVDKIRNGNFGNAEIDKNIFDIMQNAVEMGIGLTDLYRVNMRQSTSEHFGIDTRIEAAYKRKAFSDEYAGYNGKTFKESGLGFEDSVQTKLMDLQRQRVDENYFRRHFGDIGFFDENSAEYKESKFLRDLIVDSTGNKPRDRAKDKLSIYGMYSALDFYAGNTESVNGNVITLDAHDIMKQLPKSGGNTEAYQQFLFRVDGQMSEFMENNARNQGVQLVEEASAVALKVKAFNILDKDGNNRKIDKVILPIYNVSSTNDEIYRTKAVSAQVNFLNALNTYTESRTDDDLKASLRENTVQRLEKELERINKQRVKEGKTKETFSNYYISNAYNKYIDSIVRDFEVQDKNSYVFKTHMRYDVPNGAEALAISDVTFVSKTNETEDVIKAEHEIANRMFLNPYDPIDEKAIIDLKDKYAAKNRVLTKIANEIENSADIEKYVTENMKGYYKEIHGNLFKEINGRKEMVNMVEAGHDFFKKANVDFSLTALSLLEDVSENGKLTNFDSESRFGGEFTISLSEEISKWKASMEASFKDDKAMLAHIESIDVNNAKAKDIEGAMVSMVREIMGNNNISSLTSIRDLNKNNNMANERMMAINKILKANDKALDALATRYFQEVGLYGFAERYPVFESSSTVTSKIYIDKANELGIGIRFFGPQFPMFLNVDFDADDVFVQFASNKGIFRKNDELYDLFKQNYEHEALLNRHVLSAYFKDKSGISFDNNPAESLVWRVHRLSEGLVVGKDSEAYKAYETAMDEFLNSNKNISTATKNAFKEALSIDESQRTAEQTGLVNAIKFYSSFSEPMRKVIDKYDVNVLEDITNILASVKAETTKGNIGFVSNTGRDINNVAMELYQRAYKDGNKVLVNDISTIITDLDSIGFNKTFDSFGGFGLLDVAEQKAIDVKKVFEGVDLSTVSQFRNSVTALFNVQGNTKLSDANKLRESRVIMENILQSSSYQLFGKTHKDDSFDPQMLAEIIVNAGSRNDIENLAKKHNIDDQNTIRILRQYRSLYDLTRIPEASELFKNSMMKSYYGKNELETVEKMLESMRKSGDYSSTTLGIASKVIQPGIQDALVINSDTVYISIPEFVNKKDNKDNIIGYSSQAYTLDGDIKRRKDGKLEVKLRNEMSKKSKPRLIVGNDIADINRQILNILPEDTMSFSKKEFSSVGHKGREERISLGEERLAGRFILKNIQNKKNLYDMEMSESLNNSIKGIFNGDIRTQQEAIQSQLNMIDKMELFEKIDSGNNGNTISGEILRQVNNDIKLHPRKNITLQQRFEEFAIPTVDSEISGGAYERLMKSGAANPDIDYSLLLSAKKIFQKSYTDTDELRRHGNVILNKLDEQIANSGNNEELLKRLTLHRNEMSNIINDKINNIESNNQEAINAMMKTILGMNLQFFAHSEVFDSNGNIRSDANFDEALVGYGKYATRAITSLSKSEFESLSKELSNDTIKPEMKEAHDAAEKLVKAFKSMNLDEQLSDAEKVLNNAKSNADIEKEELDKITDKILSNIMNYKEASENTEKQTTGSNATTGDDLKAGRKTVTGSILDKIKAHKPDSKTIKAGLAALAVLAIPSVVGHVAHSIKTGDPLVPHSTMTDGTDPYTGDPVASSAADQQASSAPKQKQKIAPASPLSQRNIYVDQKRGLQFRVNARTKAILDNRAAGGALASQGISQGRITQYNDSSSINDNWLQAKFAEML